jgi:hypothetical protein
LLTLSQDDNIGTLPNDVRAQEKVDKEQLDKKFLTYLDKIYKKKCEMDKSNIPGNIWSWQLAGISLSLLILDDKIPVIGMRRSEFWWAVSALYFFNKSVMKLKNNKNYNMLKQSLNFRQEQIDELRSEIQNYKNHERNQKLFNKLVNDSKGNIKELLNSVLKSQEFKEYKDKPIFSYQITENIISQYFTHPRILEEIKKLISDPVYEFIGAD